MTYPGEATTNGVQQTKSGLQYIDMADGSGAAPATATKSQCTTPVT